MDSASVSGNKSRSVAVTNAHDRRRHTGACFESPKFAPRQRSAELVARHAATAAEASGPRSYNAGQLVAIEACWQIYG